MARYTTSGTKTTIASLNAELEKIQESISELLSRNGETPNQMLSALDMNSAPILNLPEPVSDSSPLRRGDIPVDRTIIEDVVTDRKTNGIHNIIDYGAVGDGVTDNTDAIQAAIDAASGAGGGTVFIPKGIFRRANTTGEGTASPTLLVTGDNVTIQGTGESSVIFHDDRDNGIRADLLRVEGDDVTIRDFKILGTARDFVIPSSFSQSLTGSGCTRLRVLNITIDAVHNMAMTITSATDVLVQGCRLNDVVRDGYRFTAGRNIRIIGNYAKNVADDVVAIHSIDSSRTTDSIVVQGNVFEHCQSMKFLGAKNVTVQGNVMRRCFRSAVWIAQNEAVEGNTNMFNINISDNIFLDIFSPFGSNSAIYVEGRPVVGDAEGIGAVTKLPYDQNYLNNIDKVTGEFQPIQKMTISNNILARTLPVAADYSDYGFGLFFDRIDEAFGTPTTSYFRTQDITDSDFNSYGVRINAAVRELKIENNLFSGHRLSAIRLIHTDFGTPITYENCLIRNNIFKNVGTSSGNAVWLQDATAAPNPNSSYIEIIENVFDGDPYFVLAGHNSDNTWNGDNDFTAIFQDNLGFLNNIVASKNTFRNVSQTGILVSSKIRVLEPNICYSDYVGSSSASNKGIRILPKSSDNILVKIDGDPTSSTFNEVVHFPETSAAATSFPLTGFWPYGHYIRNSAPSPITDPNSGLYIVTGWVKGSTNSTGAVNTDATGFYELRNFVQNVAP